MTGYPFRVEMTSVITTLNPVAEGDSKMARRRIELLEGIPLLELSDDVITIAEMLVAKQIIPAKAADDAIHIAVASVHQIDYLVTWNCKHLANPRNWRRISDCVAGFGFRATVICTPEDLIGDDN